MRAAGADVLSTAPQYARIVQEIEANAIPINNCGTDATGVQGGEHATVMPTHFYNPKLSGQLRQLADFVGG